MIGSLFTGIGSFERGLSLAGIEGEAAWQVEQIPFRQGILRKRFPGAEILPDAVKLDPTLELPLDVAEALAPELLELIPPNTAQARHLEDAIEVRGRLLTLVEELVSPRPHPSPPTPGGTSAQPLRPV